MKKLLNVLLCMVLVVGLMMPMSAHAAINLDDYEFFVTDNNGVTCTGEFESLTSGYIVFFPADMQESDVSYPLISWANGTMCAPALYYKLLSQIASGGYIVVASTELMAADGKAQVKAIDFMLQANEDENSIFYHKVNAEKIGVAGHSQGGRSSVNAAVRDARIDCVLSIAGSNFQSEAAKLQTPTFFMTGTADVIVAASLWVKPAYKKCSGPAVYASLKKAGHTTCCTSPGKYSGYARQWFDAYLKDDVAAKSVFASGGQLSCDSAWKDFMCK